MSLVTAFRPWRLLVPLLLAASLLGVPGSAWATGKRESGLGALGEPPLHLPCAEVSLHNVSGAVERYDEIVLASGSQSPEARAQAAAIGAHFSLQGQLPEARRWYERALEGLEEPPATVQDVAAYQGLGWTLARTPDHDKGAHDLSLAVRGWRDLLGPDSACEGIALERLANCLLASGRNQDALREYRTSVRILGETLSPDSLPYLRACHGYANALAYEGRLAEALPYYRDVSAACHRLLPPDDPRLAWICHDYALALHGLGRLLEAQPLYREAMEIRKGRFPDLYLQSADGLASCLTDRGDYLQARQVLEDVLGSVERDDHPDPEALARVLQSLAYLRMRTEDYDAALDLYQRVLETLGDRVTEFPYLEGMALWGLSQIADRKDDTTLAETLQRRVLELWKTIYGSESIYVDTAKGTLAEILAEEGRLQEADSLFRESLGHITTRRVQARYAYGVIAQDYSMMLRGQGHLALAAAWIDTTLSAFASVLPPGHVKRIRAYEVASQIHFARKEDSRAWEEAVIAEREGERLFQLNIRSLAETSALLYKQGAPRGLPVMLSLLARTEAPSSERIEAAWECLVASRNAVNRELERRRRTVAGPESQALRDSIDQERQELANLYVQGPSPAASRSYRDAIVALTRHVGRLEERFALLVQSGAEQASPKFSRLQGALRHGAALVAFVRYQDTFAEDAKDAYGAFVLRPRVAPRFVHLCTADSLEGLVSRVQKHMQEAPSRLRLNPEETEQQWDVLGTELRRVLWDPLGEALAGATDVYIVPDGDVWRVSFASLPTNAGGYLVESSPTIHLLGSERDLLIVPGRASGSGMLVLGGVDYDRCATRNVLSTPRILSHPPFAALPGTRREAQTVANIWNRFRAGEAVVELLGEEASETAFRRDAPQVAILHLATHGFLPRTAGEMTVGLAQQAGIALAGANSGGCSADDDGMLTASELSMLGLENTRLAFLSSCGSGLGTLVPSEGIVGLERSLRVAGCRSMVLSLWDVPDRPTQEWVERFYTHYASPGSSASAAQRKACTETLAARRSFGRSTHPFYWGGFVVIN